MFKPLIILPTYNEAVNLPEMLENVFEALPGAHVLVVDDNSPDGTAQLAKDLAAKHYQKSLHILERANKEGLGRAYLAGFGWALAHDYDLIFEMDSDFSHPASALPRFVEAIESGADLVLGSRYVNGGAVENWPLLRLLISRGGALYTRLFLGMPISDPTGGFKCFRRKVLESIDLEAVKSNGYVFQIEMTYRTWLQGFSVKEVPITFKEREQGVSKMSKSIVLEAITHVPLLRLQKNKMLGMD